MNEVSDAAQIARQSWSLLCPSDAVPVRVLTDGERYANHPAPDAAWMAAARRDGGVLESRLPQLRAMAMLLAAQRWRERSGETSARLADAADWLAARILLLGLSHVLVTAESFSLLDLANRRCRAWSEQTGQPFAPALPILVADAGGESCLQAWSRSAEVALALAGGRAEAALTRHCEQRLQALLARVSC
ncbi:hypothetical protein [Chromobacterium haemolyticum]|uniref:hypothetical protein n=1 Tax=Chromobacterium haemolyticum TaxID=394935 RepID=UPI0009D91AA7|nr:hypothetical protein [Chromobacterium haemolyticum]OQS37271.1 hypothetical protein B0T39_15790 [Chromobacterium haemolyticum]